MIERYIKTLNRLPTTDEIADMIVMNRRAFFGFSAALLTAPYFEPTVHLVANRIKLGPYVATGLYMGTDFPKAVSEGTAFFDESTRELWKLINNVWRLQNGVCTSESKDHCKESSSQ